MRTPGVAAEKMFKLVRDAVRAATKNAQTPWEESSLTGADFYFNPAGVASAPTTLSPDTVATERLFWESIKDSDDSTMFDAYLRKFPQGTFSELARLKRDAPPKAAGAAGKSAKTRQFDGEWVLEISDPNELPSGDKVLASISDGKFSVSYDADGWRGGLTGKIDGTGTLEGEGWAEWTGGGGHWMGDGGGYRKAMSIQRFRFTSNYADGSFRGTVHSTNLPFVITMHRNPINPESPDGSSIK